MRIKFLAIIASFLFVSIAISSCLDSDDTVELVPMQRYMLLALTRYTANIMNSR